MAKFYKLCQKKTIHRYGGVSVSNSMVNQQHHDMYSILDKHG